MGAESVMVVVIFSLTALFMIGIGAVQLKSKSPVGFYSGEKPPEEDELTDVPAWNRKHGIMWLLYGVVIMLSGVVAVVMVDSIWCAVVTCLGVMVPIGFMIWYHRRLERRYKR